MNWILAAILLVSLVQLVLLAVIFAGIKQFMDEFTAFFQSPDGKSPSGANVLFDVLSKRFLEQAKVTLMGLASGKARGEQAVMGEMVQDAVTSRSPGLGAILAAFPKTNKLLIKNGPLLQFLLQRFGGSSGAAPAGDHGGAGGFADNVSKYG
jgi:hypothetical protein